MTLAGACLGRASRSLIAWAPGFACLLAAGCVTYDSGLLAAASVEALPLPMTPVAERVEGRSCVALGQKRFGLAIDDAIAKAPGANALVDVALSFERLCLVVRGKAIRVEGARITP